MFRCQQQELGILGQCLQVNVKHRQPCKLVLATPTSTEGKLGLPNPAALVFSGITGDVVDLKDIQLPEGWHVQKSGGRPKKDAKFIGITLARLWQINQRKEKASFADRWIIEKWAKHGVTDEAHIRAIVRRMSKGLMAPLNKTFQIQNDRMVLAMSLVHNKGWLWCEPLTEAIPLVGNVTMTPDQTNPLAVHFAFELKSPD